MKGEDLYNLFDKYIYLLEEPYTINAKWEYLTDREKIWYNTVAEAVEVKEDYKNDI